MERVLITGATGRIGTAFRRYVGNRYRLRLGVHDPAKLDDPEGHEVVELELADQVSCAQACEGIDTVVHLAANPSPRAEFYDGLLESNIKGPYNILKAAKEMGCRRVVLGSSVQAVAGYPLDVQVHEDSPPRPLNMYGVCKCFAEAAAHYFAASEGLSCIVVRIGTWENDWIKKSLVARHLSTFVSQRDMCELLIRCIETQGVQFAIAHGVSNNRFKFLDITATRAVLGYEPKDDAFRIYGINLPYSKEWVGGYQSRGLYTVHTDGEKQAGTT
jgi:NAD+ dependent glucose-6-phosphate dehydrogenase